jgi:hypothetical protein
MLMAATAMLVVTVATIAPAAAQLTPFSCGFPSVFQSSDTTAFTKDLVTATDLEDLAINFGPSLAGACGVGFGGFPSISQTVEKTYYGEHTDFYHNEEVAAFNYPYASVGGLGGLSGLSGLPFGIC